jgi:hypothetical protein
MTDSDKDKPIPNSGDNYEQDGTLGIGHFSNGSIANSTIAGSISYTTNNYYSEKTEKDLKDPERVNNLSTEDETQKQNFNQQSQRKFFNDSTRKYLVDEIIDYYGNDQQRLINIFTLNQEIFGKNFYGNIVGNSFNSRIVDLVDELIKKNKVKDFIKIVRQEFYYFAQSQIFIDHL